MLPIYPFSQQGVRDFDARIVSRTAMLANRNAAFWREWPERMRAIQGRTRTLLEQNRRDQKAFETARHRKSVLERPYTDFMPEGAERTAAESRQALSEPGGMVAAGARAGRRAIASAKAASRGYGGGLLGGGAVGGGTLSFGQETATGPRTPGIVTRDGKQYDPDTGEALDAAEVARRRAAHKAEAKARRASARRRRSADPAGEATL